MNKFILGALACSVLMTACGNDADSKQAGEEGERLAVEIGSRSYKTEMQLQNAMFEVVTVRSEIQNKSEKAAQSFTTAFENKLREVNDSLATIILGPDA